MKKLVFQGLLMAAVGIGLTGCQKEDLNSDLSGTPPLLQEQAFSKAIELKDGALVFENQGHLDHTLNMLSEMDIEAQREWEEELGFTSLTSIFFQINAEELKHQAAFFEGVDPNLEVAEYEAMGLKYEHTQLFNDYLEKGVIREIVYTDKSRAFELVVDNPHLENVLNEAGVVIVGDRKIVVEGELTKEISLETGEILSQQAIHKTNLNGDYDFQKNARRPGYESLSGNKYWIIDPAKGDKYRYYAQAYFHSSFTTYLIDQDYYWIARAEQKKWGSWNTRNDYNPIWGISASWNYDYWTTIKGQGYGTLHTDATWPLPNSNGWATSPYYLSNLHTNFTKRYMHPHGTFTLSPPYYFWENLRVYNNSYVFKFSGGSSGYNYTAY